MEGLYTLEGIVRYSKRFEYLYLSKKKNCLFEWHNNRKRGDAQYEIGIYDSCMELMTVPKGIEYLKNLQQLDLESVSIKLQNRIEGEGSLDSPKLHYIR